MDAVRFGRALGFGARQAAKTVVSAVDAATSENPSAPKPVPPLAARPIQPASVADRRIKISPVQPAQTSPAETAKRSRQAKQGLRRGGKRFRHAAWGPFVRLSGVLWLEVMGVLFGLFALFALTGILRLRGGWHTAAPQHRQWVGSLIMLAVFGYFCVSSFVRAKHRERGR